MKKPTHIGNVTILLNRSPGDKWPWMAMVLKEPRNKKDDKRKRKRVGYGLWVPPGGGTETYDKSQKHAAQRELFEETGLRYPLSAFRKVGILKGYIGQTEAPTWLVHLYLIKDTGPRMKLTPGDGLTDARWFPANKLPFGKMLAGDKDWIPKIISGKKLIVVVRSGGETNSIKIWDIRYVHSFN